MRSVNDKPATTPEGARRGAASGPRRRPGDEDFEGSFGCRGRKRNTPEAGSRPRRMRRPYGDPQGTRPDGQELQGDGPPDAGAGAIETRAGQVGLKRKGRYGPVGPKLRLDRRVKAAPKRRPSVHRLRPCPRRRKNRRTQNKTGPLNREGSTRCPSRR